MKPTPSDEIMKTLAGGAPEVALAKGVLSQAKRDLRRFRGSQDPIGREMYRDAYNWVTSNDSAWPYSFVNVCGALGFAAEVLREELLAESESNWYTRSRQLAQKLSLPFGGSLTRIFPSRNGVTNSRRSSEPALAH